MIHFSNKASFIFNLFFVTLSVSLSSSDLLAAKDENRGHQSVSASDETIKVQANEKSGSANVDPPSTSAFESRPTFESIGIYWTPKGASKNLTASVRYRRKGTSLWRSGQDLSYALAESDRPSEYRGSIVLLSANTTYEIELDLEGNTPPEYREVTTWSEDFPIARVINVQSSSTPLEITNVHGSADGYILYTGPATIDVARQFEYNVRIQNSSYVIVRGLTLANAGRNSILLGSNMGRHSDVVHDIVIEDSEMTGWGTVHPLADSGTVWGYNLDSGVRSDSTKLHKIIVQRNRIHHPYTDTNSWREYNEQKGTYHPLGPQGITFRYSTRGYYVIRYNEIYSDNEHRFNDVMGSTNNFTYTGFPVADSDIYGNICTHTWDDGLEIEGGNMNVRIWENYVNDTYTGIAASPTTLGPLYIFRNVIGGDSKTGDGDTWGGPLFKRGGSSLASDGRAYYYNNTAYYKGAGATYQSGLSDRSNGKHTTNQVSRNNILFVWDDGKHYSLKNYSTDNNYDYDLFNGLIYTVSSSDEVNGIQGYPTYVQGAGFDLSTGTGIFELSSSSHGYDAGVLIPNFTDGYMGRAPDIGAHEAGKAPMQFGVRAGQ